MNTENICPVILAAGKGTRMKTEEQKVLTPILGKPMLSYVLDRVGEAVETDPVVVIGHEGEAVKKRFGSRQIQWVRQEKQEGTGHAVQCAMSADRVQQADALLVLCGDAPAVRTETIRSLVDTHQSEENVLTLLSAMIGDPSGYGRVIRDDEGFLEKIVEEAEANPREKRVQEINSGAMILDTDPCLEYLSDLPRRETTGEKYLTDLVAHLNDRSYATGTARAGGSDEIQGVNTLEQKSRASTTIQHQIFAQLMKKGVDIRSPEKTHIEPDVQIGSHTTIEPFVVIRNGVEIAENCRVGPFSHLREGTILEENAEIGNYVETKKTRVGPGSKAKHLAYLGDATLGSDVNIGAGTITANYDGSEKHRTRLGDGVSTGSNTVLVAPVEMKKNSKSGAGAIILSGENVEEGVTVIGVPARPIQSKKPSDS